MTFLNMSHRLKNYKKKKIPNHCLIQNVDLMFMSTVQEKHGCRTFLSVNAEQEDEDRWSEIGKSYQVRWLSSPNH